MKNKKLIATVASLCLVLVAVVAAVIGVLAAATQQANTKFKVSYEARNVYATVSLAGKKALDTGWQAEGTGDALSHTFYAQDSKENANLLYADANAIALTQDGNDVNTFAVYRFSFTNNVTTATGVSNAYLKITLKLTGNTGTNVVTKWFSSSSDAVNFEVAYSTELGNEGKTAYNSITVKSGSTATAIADNNMTASDGYVLQANLAPQGSYYAYLVVAIADLNKDAQFLMDGSTNSLLITLDAVAAPAQGD